MNPNLITLSYPTTGPVGGYQPGASAVFFSSGYTPPEHGRSIGWDVVHNQNGVFKYIYDNGPNHLKFEPFQLILDDNFASLIGTATIQYQNLINMWQHIGPLTMRTPDGEFTVHWVGSIEKEFIKFPDAVGDKIEYRVTVQFEEIPSLPPGEET